MSQDGGRFAIVSYELEVDDTANEPRLTVSEEIEQVTGYPADLFKDNLQFFYETLVHPSDREQMWARFVDPRGELRSEYRILTKDGAVIDVVDVSRRIRIGETSERWIGICIAKCDHLLLDTPSAPAATLADLGLRPQELRLLRVLLRSPRQPRSTREILRGAWGSDHVPNSSVVRTTVHRLRKKLEPLDMDVKAVDDGWLLEGVLPPEVESTLLAEFVEQRTALDAE